MRRLRLVLEELHAECHPTLNDQAIVPDIGIAASFDPVAFDRACCDLVTSAPACQGSIVQGKDAPDVDKFRIVHPEVDGAVGLA
jgi:hypothetical protein